MKIQGKVMLFGLGLFLSAGCLQIDELPPEPSVEFVSITQFTDSAALVFAFQDGDGDIGLTDSDTTGQFAPGQTFFHNLFVEYFEKQNGVWQQINLQLPYRYRIPVITPTGQNKSLEGEISIALTPFPTDPLSPFDTVKYSIQLADRAFHLSNVVETPELVIP